MSQSSIDDRVLPLCQQTEDLISVCQIIAFLAQRTPTPTVRKVCILCGTWSRAPVLAVSVWIQTRRFICVLF